MSQLINKGIPNDSVESIRVSGGQQCRVAVYQHANGSGWQLTLSEGEYTCDMLQERGGYCNDLSSAKVWREPIPTETPCELMICENNDFTSCITVTEGEYNLSTLRDMGMPNDSTESVRVSGSPNCRAELWQHGGFSGWMIPLEAGEYNCDAIKAAGGKCNDMSSVKVYRGQ